MSKAESTAADGGGSSLLNFFNFAWQTTAILAIVVTLSSILITTILNQRNDAVFRMCGTCVAVGETGSVAYWTITLNGNSDSVSFDFRILATTSTVRAIEVRGPLQLGLNTGPLAAVFCGQASITDTIPTLPPCNVLDTPGQVQGLVPKIYNGTVPVTVGAPTRDFMQAVRDDPKRFYAEIMTDNFPTTPGAMRCTFAGSYCGAP